MGTIKLILRWSWRDLRSRWVQVTAIALIIALGTGVYAGLGAGTVWRLKSYEDSYRLLNMYDLRVKLGQSFVDAEKLLDVVRGITHPEWIQKAEIRLIASTLVDASTRDQTILVPGRIVGVNVANSGPQVNGLSIASGRGLTGADSGKNVAILEYHFARYYGLSSSGIVRLSGGATLDYVGSGYSPEYFMVMTDEGGMMAEANFAAIFVPIETAQTLTGRTGMANDLVLTLSANADPAAAKTEVEQAIAQHFPQITAVVSTAKDDDAYNALYSDASSDQETFTLIAFLFLCGAAFGAFNLTNRMVEAQRREIGIGMAIGMPTRLIAIRPLLVALQIAVLGVVLGIGAGLLLSYLWGKALIELMPMPIFEAPLQLSLFLEAAILGLLLPFAAAIYPIWRAVQVAPIDAIKTGYLVTKGGGLAPVLARLPLPGGSLTQMPFRNVLRSPRRTLLTLLGIASAVTLLIAMLGILDSMFYTIDKGKVEILQANPERVAVDLNFFYPTGISVADTIRKSPAVAAAEPGIRIGGYLQHGGQKIETFLDLVNLDSTIWKPTIIAGARHSDGPGVLIAEKAARDLGVKPGDRIILTHPQREGLFSFRMLDTEVEVVGTHALPLRFMTYMDIKQASLMGLQGLTNTIQVLPAAGYTRSDVQRALFNQMGVASVQPVSTVVDVFEKLMEMFIGFMSLVAIAVMAMAFLITFNSTSISVDERAREIATMFAFGMRVRSVTLMTMLENLIMGILGTGLGIILGYLLLYWLLMDRMATMLPDISLVIMLSPLTLLMAGAVGILVVALTPLLTTRRLARMDIPSMLRVVE